MRLEDTTPGLWVFILFLVIGIVFLLDGLFNPKQGDNSGKGGNSAQGGNSEEGDNSAQGGNPK